MFLTKNFKVKKTSVTFLNFFKNLMIRNSKIHNILDTIEISKSIEPSKCIPIEKIMTMFI
jgi:hypothetical protein